MYAHSIKNPHIIHLIRNEYYLCMRACSTTPSKSTTNLALVTCKNCLRQLRCHAECHGHHRCELLVGHTGPHIHGTVGAAQPWEWTLDHRNDSQEMKVEGRPRRTNRCPKCGVMVGEFHKDGCRFPESRDALPNLVLQIWAKDGRVDEWEMSDPSNPGRAFGGIDIEWIKEAISPNPPKAEQAGSLRQVQYEALRKVCAPWQTVSSMPSCFSPEGECKHIRPDFKCVEVIRMGRCSARFNKDG